MPSDDARRLHPASIFFNLAGPLKALIVPAGVIILPGRIGPDGFDGPWWAAGALVLSGIAALVKYLTFTYEYGETELVIRSGLLFKSERHIPYGRIQNIDARQHLVHRLLGVQTIVIETGGGSEAEATLSVLDEGALDEMRRRVSAGGAAGVLTDTPAESTSADVAADDAGAVRQAPQLLLHLGVRDLLICGLIRGRGLVLALAAAGLAFQYGIVDRAAAWWGADPEASDSAREMVAAFFESGAIPVWSILIALAAAIAVLVFMRGVAVVLTFIRLFDFTLVDDAGKLRMTYGLLTRVRAVIPVARIQSVTLREGPIHRWTRTTSVRAETAGGDGGDEVTKSREWIAPIIQHDEADAFVARLIPDADAGAAEWRAPHPRARRRAFVQNAIVASLGALPALWYLGVYALPLVVVAMVFAWWEAGRQVRHMALAVTGRHVMFRSGWLWRQMTIAPLDKVQSVATHASPFDRRHGMARLVVDTAGASDAPHRLNIPWLGAADAATLSRDIGTAAAASAFRW